MQIINQYSMLWGGILILALVGFLILRKEAKLVNIAILIGLGAVLAGGWLVLRPDQASMNEMNQFQVELGDGQPVLLELQSPF